jgi:hypothetical protein
MIKTIVIIILIMSLVDLTATYFYVSTFKNKFPQLDYTALEANPILKTSWKLFGLQKGMIIGGLLVIALLSLIVLSVSEKWQYYLLGLFSMMIVYHLLNFAQLAALKPVGAP